MTMPQDRRDLPPSINSQYENKLALRTSPATEIKTEHGGKDDDTDLPTDPPLDQKDLTIYQEIAYFRERAAARERERRQREEEERANRRAKAEKERERSHGRVNREKENVREKESGITRSAICTLSSTSKFYSCKRINSRRESYILAIKKRNNADKLKEKLKRKWLLKREKETMATNREREAERDLDVRKKPIRDREIMARKLAEEYHKDRDLVRWWFHRQQFRARELAIDEADRLREQQEIELEQHRLQTLEEERKQREEAMEAELNKKF